MRDPRVTRLSFEEYMAVNEVTFEWADSYDTKDWKRLKAIIAPSLIVDYTEVGLEKWESMSAEEFMDMVTHQGFLGDPLVNTQHMIGASKWEKISEVEIIGKHQIRAAHQRYTHSTKNVVAAKGHGHALIQHRYLKIDGAWKLAGLRPSVRWNEFEFEKIFKGIKS